MDPDPGSLANILASISTFFSDFGLSVVIIFALLTLSAIISGTEVAFFSLSQAEIDDFKHRRGKVWELIRKPRKLLATILIFNNLVNVGIILISTFTLSRMAATYGWNDTPVGTVILQITEIGLITLILLFFGEITPKVYAAQKRLLIVRRVALPLQVLSTLFSPLSWVLIRSTRFIDKRINWEKEGASHEDIKHAIDLTSEEESPEEEKEILKGIVNFSSIAVKSIMRARVDIAAIEAKVTFDEVIGMINEYGYSRIPVYEDSLDQIKGILYAKDLLPLLKKDAREPQWQKLIRDAYFIPESKKIDDLLEEFKTRRLHIAIVVDEFGGTAGLVTLEDIIEEIFGEINDEYDEEELIFSKLSETEYVFEGKTPLNDLVKITSLPDNIFDEAKGDNDSLAGLILEVHGRIPSRGEVIEMEQFRFHIESVTQNRIKRVKFVILAQEDEEQTKESD